MPKGTRSDMVYQPSALYKDHYPLWDIYSKEEAIRTQWDWITTVRYKTGDYASKLGAFPIYMTERANTKKSLTVARIYIPSRYRPMLRLLNFKQAWHMFCLSMREPRKPKPSVKEVIPYVELARRFEVWIDGARRNIIYCDSIRNAFFGWIEDTYYGRSSAIDVEPRVKTMADDQHCNILENWFVHEIVIKSHIPAGINLWLCDKKNKRLIKGLQNVFDLGMMGFATNMSDLTSVSRF
jgi:hypothetical protein